MSTETSAKLRKLVAFILSPEVTLTHALVLYVLAQNGMCHPATAMGVAVGGLVRFAWPLPETSAQETTFADEEEAPSLLSRLPHGRGPTFWRHHSFKGRARA